MNDLLPRSWKSLVALLCLVVLGGTAWLFLGRTKSTEEYVAPRPGINVDDVPPLPKGSVELPGLPFLKGNERPPRPSDTVAPPLPEDIPVPPPPPRPPPKDAKFPWN
jgi:hypothetical protein